MDDTKKTGVAVADGDVISQEAALGLLAACDNQIAWIERLLTMLEGRTIYDNKSEAMNGFAGTMVPDWDLRQKLDSLKEDVAKARRGFTLIELMVVMVIILLISVVALPTIIASYSHRQVSEAGRIVQGAFVGARDNAIRNNRPSGIRLLPDPVFMTASVVVGKDSAGNPIIGPDFPRLANGQIDPSQILACNRIVPLDPAPEYSEGMVSVFPSQSYAALTAMPCLVIEESVGVTWIKNTLTGKGYTLLPNPPTSWFWNIRVGDKLQINQAGPWYTVVGPVVVPNPEMFVNIGSPGTPNAYSRPMVAPDGTTVAVNPDFLFLVNGKDDNANGWTDDGFDGVDNNLIGGVDDLSEWESEQWLGSIGRIGVANLHYTIRRRPTPSTNAREVALPTNVVIDLTGWGMVNPPRSRPGASLNQTTGYIDIMANPDGTIIPTTVYSSPSSVGLAGAFLHLWLAERGDLAAPVGNAALVPPKGEWSLVTIFAKSGNVVINSDSGATNPFIAAQQGSY